MNDPLLDSKIPELRALARSAGQAIMTIYRSGFEVDRKSDDSPLTQADLAAHHLLLQGLNRLFPTVPVLSEESAQETAPAVRRGWSRLWLVDPLDGTREFVDRRDEFTVNLALVDAHRAIFGLVHLPALDVTYWGRIGQGAWRARADGPAEPIRCAAPAAQPLRVLGSRSHADEHLAGFLRSLPEHELQTAGSSLKFCRIAEGEADLYPRFGPTSEWDTAAGQAVVEAAGGLVVDLQGRALRYNLRDSLLNPWFLVCGDPRLDWRAHLESSGLAGASS